MNEYLRTGGLPIPLPDDEKILRAMLSMQKAHDPAPEMVEPMERKLKKIQETK